MLINFIYKSWKLSSSQCWILDTHSRAKNILWNLQYKGFISLDIYDFMLMLFTSKRFISGKFWCEEVSPLICRRKFWVKLWEKVEHSTILNFKIEHWKMLRPRIWVIKRIYGRVVFGQIPAKLSSHGWNRKSIRTQTQPHLKNISSISNVSLFNPRNDIICKPSPFQPKKNCEIQLSWYLHLLKILLL